MPPKIIYTKEKILNTAFDLVRKNGLKILTARYLAKKLKSSIAPIYSYFESMDELKAEVMRKATDLMFEYAVKPYSDRPFLNLGLGITLFARDESELYQALFLDKKTPNKILEDFKVSVRTIMDKDKRFDLFLKEEKDELLQKMWIYTHGLSFMICGGFLKYNCQKYLTKVLMAGGSGIIGKAIIDVEMRKHGKEANVIDVIKEYLIETK